MLSALLNTGGALADAIVSIEVEIGGPNGLLSPHHMSKESVRTETRPRPVAPLLAKELVDIAPTHRGLDALMDWLDNGHLHDAIRQEVNARCEFLPPLESLGPILRSHVEHSLESETRTARLVLWRYAEVRHQIITYHDPEKAYWRQKARKGLPESAQPDSPRPGRFERLKERQLVMERLIRDFRLGREKAVIDYLVEEAASIAEDGGERESASALPAAATEADG